MTGRLTRRLWTLITRERVKDDVQRELACHIAMDVEHRQRQGMSAEEARRTALRDFGGVGRVREDVHDSRGITWFDSWSQDIRFSLRMLRRWPGYTVAVVSTLALGIGANTAIFSVVNDVLLQPLPYKDGEQLVRLLQTTVRPSAGEAGVSINELQEYRASLQTVDNLLEYHNMSFVLLNQGEPDRVDTGVVSSNFFDAFGVRPLYGRGFSDEDDDLGAPAVVLLSQPYWTQKFGGDPSVVGRVVEMNDKPHTVIGVLPAIPQYPRENDVYMPTSACPFRATAETRIAQDRRAFSGLRVFGRLKDNAAIESANAEVSAVAQRFAADHPQVYDPSTSQFAGRLVRIEDEITEDARPILLALLATTALVLLISCANVANLSMSRMARREREIAVRVALGAGRGRLIRQLVTESALLSMVGGSIGLALAWATTDMLARFAARFTPRSLDPAIDVTVLLFTAALSLFTAFVFGIIPALSARPALASALKQGSAQAGDGVRSGRIRSALVIAQVSVCSVLLVGAGLFIETLRHLSRVDLGYRADRVLTAEVFENWSRQTNRQQFVALYTTILDRLRGTPGVLSAAITDAVPLSDISPLERPIRIEGQPFRETRDLPIADQNVASDQYFEALGVTPLRGRVITMQDHGEAPPVAVINQTMAALWGDRDPVGGRFQSVGGPTPEPPWITVIGVVPDIRLYDVNQGAAAQYYRPFLQNPGIGARVLIRTEGDPMSFVPALKAAVYAAHPEVPVEAIETLESLRAGRLASPGLSAALLTIFAGLALVITLAGIAAVIGTSVSQRTREFGVRMALGAAPSSVLTMVLRQGLTLVAIGLAGGTAAAVALGQLLSAYLYQTTPTDPFVYAVVAAIFVTAAAMACLGPARRATSVDPLLALKAP